MDIEAAAAASSNEAGTRNHHNHGGGGGGGGGGRGGGGGGGGMQLDIHDDHQTSVEIIQKRVIRWKLLLLCCVCSAIGIIGGPMLQRLYYTHGGNRKWMSSWLQTVGFPFLVAPLSYIYVKKTYGKDSSLTSWVFLMEPKLFIPSAVIGVLLGFDNYMYSAGLSYLPVSTSSLLFSTQLAFTALFAFLVVKQKFTFYSLNSVVLMTLGAAVLALNTSSDRPPGVSQGKYFLGFFLTLGGAGLLGFSMPLVEFAYGKSSKPITYTVVMQFQFVLSFFATLVCTGGMLINKDFQIIPREGRNFDLGQGKYYFLLVALAVVWQLFSMGFLGIIFCTSSLFAGIFTTVMLPFTQIAATIAFDEKFTGQKGMSLALCLWGFTSYFIGEYKKTKKPSPIANAEEVKNNNIEFTESN